MSRGSKKPCNCNRHPGVGCVKQSLRSGYYCRNDKPKETPMPPNEPASFTDEDRTRLHRLLAASGKTPFAPRLLLDDAAALTRALAYITYLEGALRALADEFEKRRDENEDREGPYYVGVADGFHDAFLAARAALKGEDDA